jgi:long-subunit acyl-CoA synthetase (AMP-forming)
MPGAVSVVCRKSNLFKLQQGEFISPEHLEVTLHQSRDRFNRSPHYWCCSSQGIYVQCPSVRQIFVYGDPTRTYLVAVVTLNIPGLMAQKSELGCANVLNHLVCCR